MKKNVFVLSLLSVFIVVASLLVSAVPVSAAACNASLLRVVRQGQKGNHVKALQECLITRGYNISSGVSGHYDIHTRNAVKALYKSELGVANWSGRVFGLSARALLSGKTVNKISSVAGLKRIANETEFKKYLKNSSLYAEGQIIDVARPTSLDSVRTDSMSSPKWLKSLSAPSKLGLISSAPSRVSTTNVQVVGIDEPDIVKTDGVTIYFSRERDYNYPIYCDETDCSKLKSTPGVTAITAFPLASLGIASDSIPERGKMLFVKDSKVLIVMTSNSVVAYDVSNPSNPVKKWTNNLASNTQITSARLKGNTMYLITSTYLYSTASCPIIPMTRGKISVSIPCGDIWAPSTPEPTNTTYTVFAIDPTTGVEKNVVTYLGDSNNTTISMFGDNLYIAYRMSSSEYTAIINFLVNEIGDLISSDTVAKIRKISAYDISIESKLKEVAGIIEADNKSRSQSEKLKVDTELKNRLATYLEKHQRDMDRTTVVRVQLSNLTVAATGIISGHLLNQFSMDEHNGNLRVATTVGETSWSGNSKSVNDVYVLNQKLETIGKVLDMGITERIYSARFIGDRGYIVTFRQTDPFYVLDLSVPTAPKMVGELKIPGYSAYLEPLSENMVLGVGREDRKVKMSLFDVTDPKNPTEKSKYMLDESWTEVESNHHAFLRDPKHNVFFIPGGKGGYVISYADNTLSLKATVAASQVKRALFIEDILYIVAQKQITLLDENTWQEVKTLSLTREADLILMRDEKRIADIKQLQTGLELYFNEKNEYPATATIDDGIANNATIKLSGGNGFSSTTAGTVYLENIPENKLPNGTSYVYTRVSSTNYTLTFNLESGAGSLSAGMHTASPNGIK